LASEKQAELPAHDEGDSADGCHCMRELHTGFCSNPETTSKGKGKNTSGKDGDARRHFERRSEAGVLETSVVWKWLEERSQAWSERNGERFTFTVDVTSQSEYLLPWKAVFEWPLFFCGVPHLGQKCTGQAITAVWVVWLGRNQKRPAIYARTKATEFVVVPARQLASDVVIDEGLVADILWSV
jgi:hypothetical protein